MALGVSRLLLSLSAMKRTSGEARVAADYILTQDENFIIAQNGWVILANQSRSDTIKPDISSYLETEDGLNILLTQDDDVISTQQYRESAGEFFGDRDILTQDGEAIYTQDGRSIQEDTPFIFNLMLTQDGDVITTQELAPLTLQQNELLISAHAKLVTQYGIELRTQDGNDFLTEQIITTSAFDPPYVLEENDLVTQDGLFLTTQDNVAIQLQDVYIAA